jgi:hypothetical protein
MIAVATSAVRIMTKWDHRTSVPMLWHHSKPRSRTPRTNTPAGIGTPGIPLHTGGLTHDGLIVPLGRWGSLVFGAR